jgi:hypothetical protein
VIFTYCVWSICALSLEDGVYDARQFIGNSARGEGAMPDRPAQILLQGGTDE